MQVKDKDWAYNILIPLVGYVETINKNAAKEVKMPLLSRHCTASLFGAEYQGTKLF
jgi:hypothetical protein